MKALIIVDMQRDFMPGGALGVPKGDQIIAVINALMPKFPLVVATKDWHPEDHMSFAANHPGKNPGDIVTVKDIPQILWPIHCVRNTPGAEFASGLNQDKIVSVFYKGTDRWVDSYSTFFDNKRHRSTGLAEYLKSRSVSDVYIAGLATDYCVLYSTLDAIDLGFNVFVISDACRAINLKPDDESNAFAAMTAKGAKIVMSKDIE